LKVSGAGAEDNTTNHEPPDQNIMLEMDSSEKETSTTVSDPIEVKKDF